MLIFIASLKEAFALSSFEAENLISSLPAKIKYEYAHCGLVQCAADRGTFIEINQDIGLMNRLADLHVLSAVNWCPSPAYLDDPDPGPGFDESHSLSFYQLINELMGRDRLAGWGKVRAALLANFNNHSGQVSASAHQSLWHYFKASLISLSMVDRSEALKFLYDSGLAFQKQAKNISLENYETIIASASTLNDLENEKNSPSGLAGGLKKNRLPISCLLGAIRDEAERQGLSKKDYVSSDRTIRNWLSASTSPPPGFSELIFESTESIATFAASYIKRILDSGSSQLVKNAKKEVQFVDGLHGVVLETPEDALMMAEACRELADRLPGGKATESPRKGKSE